MSDFLATLVAGDVGCLRGGTYSDGETVTWRRDGTKTEPIIVQSYPSEQAEVVGTELSLAGDYLVARDLTVRDVTFLDGDGLKASGIGARLEHNTVRHIARHGILLATTSHNTIVGRNFVDDVGWNSSDPAHGVYVQGKGHVIRRNVFSRAESYGIHLYAHPSNIVVAQNTSVQAINRGGVLIRTDGSGITVVSNIFAGNATHGITYDACGEECTVDNNITWENADGGVGGELAGKVTNNRDVDPLFIDARYHIAAASPAIDTGRKDYAFLPDLDGLPLMGTSPPDLGAYER